MTNKKILIITGDAGESFEILYACHRLREAGYEPVIAAPSVRRLNLVIHDFEPGWDTYVERMGYIVESEITFDDVSPADTGWTRSGIPAEQSPCDQYYQRILLQWKICFRHLSWCSDSTANRAGRRS
jgi:hypothetical protein